jgi:medium-chain acyl-[acyl-carrier-protein] hydrolase
MPRSEWRATAGRPGNCGPCLPRRLVKYGLLMNHHRGQTGVAVFCLPHAGGSASLYTPWTRVGWPEDLEFVPVELPGHPGRMAEPMPADMPDLIDSLLDSLRPRITEPFAIFGHSMGALVGYELARRLADTGWRPECLIVSGTGPPGVAAPVPAGDWTDGELARWLIRLGGTPLEVFAQPDLLRVALRILRADLTLLERYGSPQPTVIPVPVAAFGGTADPCAPTWQIEKWQAVTSQSFRLRTFSGGHFYLRERQPAVLAEIAGAVRACAPWLLG